MAEYLSEFELPSKGLVYDEAISSHVTIRAMTTKEEKMLVGSGEESIRRIFSACIIEPKNVDINKLIIADQHFILMKLRIVSYGKEYQVTVPCDKCAFQNKITLDLEELPVNYLPDDFKEPIEIILPAENVIVGLRLLRFGDLIQADRKAKKFMKKGSVETGDLSFIFRLCHSIATIEGKQPESFSAVQAFVENLIGKDSAFIHHTLSKVEVGYDVNLLESCRNCGEDIEFVLPMTSEFFRPTFD